MTVYENIYVSAILFIIIYTILVDIFNERDIQILL